MRTELKYTQAQYNCLQELATALNDRVHELERELKKRDAVIKEASEVIHHNLELAKRNAIGYMTPEQYEYIFEERMPGVRIYNQKSHGRLEKKY